ncbi:hypothetical protein ACJMK2_010813 [Sinanodonta woodiana]|uniref:Protein NDRG3 n=3 Tax=Sinanodonta woodiana TaxID=1069815 RepID=A0ABD3VJL3_SINWO
MENQPFLGYQDGQRASSMEQITNIELSSIQVQEPKLRSFVPDASNIIIQEEDVETPYGNVHVAIQGDRSKIAIFTYHDIGLNHVTCFQGFFSYMDMQPILRHFCVYHLNAPGQEEASLHLKPDFIYPTMDELAESVLTVVEYFGVKRFIGFGVGAGANILSRFALAHPEHMDSLVLVNPTSTRPGWIEWGYQKMNSWYLWSGQVTNFTEEYLLWHWFGAKTRWDNHDLITVYQEYIKSINPQNLSLFIESYLKRTDLTIIRELDPIKKKSARTINCRTLVLVGDDSPHIDDVVNMNGRMDPQETDFMKIQDCGGMPLEEQPGKVCEAFRLFLQGMGYVPSLRGPSHEAVSRQSHQDVFSSTELASSAVC